MQTSSGQSWPVRIAALALLAITSLAGTASANSTAAQQQAERELLSRPLPQRARARVQDVLNDACFFRRPASDRIACDPNFYRFVLSRPDVVVDIWRVLGVSDIRLRQTGPDQYFADDGSGTTTRLEYLYRGEGSYIVYAEGTYTGPLALRTMRGSAVLHLQTSHSVGADGRPQVTHRLDVFLRLHNLGAELVARGMTSQLGTMTDRNFREVSTFLQSLAGRIEADADWSDRLAANLTGVSDDTRLEFARVVAGMHAQQNAPAMQGPLVAQRDQSLPPRLPLPEAVTEPYAAPRTAAAEPVAPELMPESEAYGPELQGQPAEWTAVGSHEAMVEEPVVAAAPSLPFVKADSVQAAMATRNESPDEIGLLRDEPAESHLAEPIAPHSPLVPVVKMVSAITEELTEVLEATPEAAPMAEASHEPMTTVPAAPMSQARSETPAPAEGPQLKGPIIPGLTGASAAR
jgi:hypothetical protein